MPTHKAGVPGEEGFSFKSGCSVRYIASLYSIDPLGNETEAQVSTGSEYIQELRNIVG